MTPTKQSFPKTRRILKSRDFKFLLRHGKTIRERGVIIHYVKGPSESTFRLGVAVSRRAVKKAAARNWIKRRIREYFRRKTANLSQATDLLIRVDRADNLFKKSELQEILNLLFGRMELY